MNNSRKARFADASAVFVENLLESVGLWRVAQRVRRMMNRYMPLDPRDSEKLKVWIQGHIDLDVTVQKLAQYKRRLSLDPDNSASISSSDSDLVSLEDKIAAYNTCASMMQRVLQRELDELLDSPVKRAILCLRRNTQWESSELLRTQCADRNGCCARQCGCCQQPRAEITIKGTGHCTLACICCERNRRSHVDPLEGNTDGLLQSAMVLDVYDSRSQNGLLKAFVWGV